MLSHSSYENYIEEFKPEILNGWWNALYVKAFKLRRLYRRFHVWRNGWWNVLYVKTFEL